MAAIKTVFTSGVPLTVAALAFGLMASGAPQRVLKRRAPCKTPEIAASCYWTHGRLAVYNGGPPNVRLWKIGTKRILGILSGPGDYRADEENSGPELPRNAERAFKSIDMRIFADFEVCPLEPEKPGVMQSACIDAAKDIFVQH